MDDPKPCPFCGDAPVMHKTEYGAVYIKCVQCGVTTMFYPDVETAIKKWNNRINY